MFGQERSEASQHGPKMMMMMVMGGGEDNVVIDGDINHGWTGEEAEDGPGPGSVTQLRDRSPGTQQSQDPDPGPQMQDQHTREEVARICHSGPCPVGRGS